MSQRMPSYDTLSLESSQADEGDPSQRAHDSGARPPTDDVEILDAYSRAVVSVVSVTPTEAR